MASIDYGTILVKNGELINTERYMEKSDMGVSYEEITSNLNNERNVDCSGSVIVGDADFCITFWKNHATIIMNHKVCGQIWYGSAGCFIPDSFYLVTKAPWERIINIFNSGISIIIECIDHNIQADGYYSSKYHIYFEYKGAHYDIYTGYGIDSDVNVYNRIKFSMYGYTEKEREVLDKVFNLN